MTASRSTVLIYGAGAIGRGYMPWVFSPEHFDIVFVERNKDLREALARAGQFTSFRTIAGRYERLVVPVAAALAPGEDKKVIDRAHAAVSAVGPRNVLAIAAALQGTSIPILCCENDPASAEAIRIETGNPNVAFAVPDVITSNTASEEILQDDPLGIITEHGICFADEIAAAAGGDVRYVSADELRQQWTAKLYLHNTPHCIAAYLGSFLDAQYLHEAMADKAAHAIVEGAMREMQQTLISITDLEKDFIDWYADKELQRFSNTLLCDPVSRVAREPFRKLAPNERLLGAAQLCLSAGIFPANLMLGIMAAFFYDNPQDPDANIRYLVRSLELDDFLRIVMGLETDEALQHALARHWNENVARLRALTMYDE